MMVMIKMMDDEDNGDGDDDVDDAMPEEKTGPGEQDGPGREVDVQLGDDRGVGHVWAVRSGCGYEDD